MGRPTQRMLSLLKRIPLFLLATCGGSKASGGADVACDEPATIQVVAQGLQHHKGEVRVALFESGEGFPGEPEKSLQQGIATLEGETASFEFQPVPCGRYAVSVFHDENGDGVMQRDWLGRPKEGWGVSRDARGRFGPPSFDDSAFEAEGETLSVRLNLQY
ncbi:MAG: DUF2141 domain-containing protein [Candidatus Latescibacterota bacterium]|nr:MAG: DUF2141 domain-containing protein [Candidatus Latescibacterota bacterium]